LNKTQEEGQLENLFKDLAKYFNLTTFNEILYFMVKIWETKTNKKKEENINELFSLPKFGCFYGFEEKEIPRASSYESFIELKSCN
jgi:hypothetical protein